jgi:hypothetical protein
MKHKLPGAHLLKEMLHFVKQMTKLKININKQQIIRRL